MLLQHHPAVYLSQVHLLLQPVRTEASLEGCIKKGTKTRLVAYEPSPKKASSLSTQCRLVQGKSKDSLLAGFMAIPKTTKAVTVPTG